MMPTKKLIEDINRIKKEKNAILLVHNYQRQEIYEVADFIGDSLELSRKAAETNADTIVFCGVKFMAETAKILNPSKNVLLPNLSAGCSLADMITLEDVEFLKANFPNAAVVSYVNTNADVKAVSDICCTSANAIKVVNSLPNDEVIFLPDKNLGRYVQSFSEKKMILWDGFCSIHQELDSDDLISFKREHPLAKIIAHPECNKAVLEVADHICSTGGMGKFAAMDEGSEYIVVTECGMTNKLRDDVPGKEFFSFCNLCHYMKATTLELVLEALIEDKNPIIIDPEIMDKARNSITRMLAVV